MRRAIALGEAARLVAPPNPWIGCVLVRDGVIVGSGQTQAAGSHHAEVMALKEAGDRARGSSAYVTLEPCSHYGRTPPCCDALIKAGVGKVVVAVTDPDLRVAGRGIAALRAAGIEVEVGIAADEVERSLRAYLHQRRTGKPYCIAKAAVSLDGRLAAADGSSRWISGPEARRDAHRLRAESQAIIVGSGTAIADQPALTVRDWTAPTVTPVRVVLDARGSTPVGGPLADAKLAPTLIVTTDKANSDWMKAWRDVGAEVIEVAAASDDQDYGVDLEATLRLLAQRGVVQVLVEGGARLHTRLFLGGLIDQLTVYVGPCLLGNQGLPFLPDLAVPTIASAPRLKLLASQPFGDTLRLDYATD